MWSRQLMNLVYLFLVGIIHFLMWLLGGTVTCTDNKYVWIWKNMGICIRPGTAMRSLYVLWLYCRHACRLYENFCMTTLGIPRCARPKPSIMCTLLLSLCYIRGQLDLGSLEGGGGSCIIMMIQGFPLALPAWAHHVHTADAGVVHMM